jgi:membrane fusion protein, multidrug efflux system
MTTTAGTTSKKTWPAIVLVLAAIALLIFGIARLDRAPRTDDAYASADTIDVVPEVSGRIVELAVRNNHAG